VTVVIGVDAGGSKTVAAVRQDGRELARASGRGSAVRPDRAIAAATAIAAVVRQALHQANLGRGDVLVVGAAGAGREEERRALREALRHEGLAHRVAVTTDLDIAVRAALGGKPGIVLLAGTGSVAAARLPGGGMARQGGYGWQMGDEGGGYALGRAALIAIGRARDGRGPPTALFDAVLLRTRCDSFDALVRWSLLAGPGEVALLAPAVLQQAAAGDEVANEILRHGAADLAAHVEALAARFPGAPSVPLALGGGLLDEPAYRERVLAALSHLPRLDIRPEPVDPVCGALELAEELAAAAPDTNTRD
jgi:N-acetylglucosamine kinase-like BadF-type ATPase